MNKEKLMLSEEEVKTKFRELIKDIPDTITKYLFMEQENKQLKEEINKISKKELKVRDMLYSIENGTLTRERLIQIEEVLFEIGDSKDE